jgi:hypothetical protein
MSGPISATQGGSEVTCSEAAEQRQDTQFTSTRARSGRVYLNLNAALHWGHRWSKTMSLVPVLATSKSCRQDSGISVTDSIRDAPNFY